MTDIVYRTNDPKVRTVLTNTTAVLEQYEKKRREAIASWGFDPSIEVYTTNSAFGGKRFVGLYLDRTEEEGRDWKRNRDEPTCIEPRRATKRGKEIDAEFRKLATVPTGRSDIPGMPSMHMHARDGQMYASTFALKQRDDYVWVLWKDSAPKKEIDGTIWEPVKLSEFYAMVEAGDDIFGVLAKDGDDDADPDDE